MCYAIPGKVVEVNAGEVSIDYFGELRRAKNDFFKLTPGEYVYAQGGLVIQRISSQEAEPVLESWKELFLRLKEVDAALSKKNENLYQRANYIRLKHLGNACCVHGIIEFSNYCRNDCLYCGLRKSNVHLARYRMSINEIIKIAEDGINKLNFKALVLQSGEDIWFDEEKLSLLVEGIRQKGACLIILSIGERDIKLYEKLYTLGARAVLLRFETSNPDLYAKLRPGHRLERRLALIRKLRKIGYLIMTGFLVGLPTQTPEDIQRDIKITADLGTDLFSFGPFLPHPHTPLAKEAKPALKLILDTIARCRLNYPEAKILVTTAVETLDKEKGLQFGLLAGGNSLMINITPPQYQKLYEIYPERAGIDEDVRKKIKNTLKLLHSLGRAPVDLGI